MQKSDKKYNDPWDRDYYGTGSTRPPKQHGGLIAFLLVLVVLLGGICSALGLLNLRLLQQLAQAQPDPDTLYLFDDAQDSAPANTIAPGDDRLPQLGVKGQTVSEFDRRYYELPEGVLITDVAEDLCAYEAGIRAGDVICALEGNKIASQEELTSVLEECVPGQQVQVEYYRTKTQKTYSVTLTITEEEKE